MLLDKLLNNISGIEFDITSSVSEYLDIQNISLNSKEIRSGGLFFALKGLLVDGHDFIQDAIQNGAVAIICSNEGTSKYQNLHPSVTFISTCQGAKLSAIVASHFYSTQPPVLCAVTGTNGKTSVADFTRQLWEMLGYSSASMGTLGIRSLPLTTHKHMTTPDFIYLHDMLNQLAQAHVTHVCLEASSHGIHQHRLEGIRFKAAGYTNLSRDHLDYHDTMENYGKAKSLLFSHLLDSKGIAVINGDVPESDSLINLIKAQRPDVKILSYGYKGQDLNIKSIKPLQNTQHLKLNVLGKNYSIDFPLIGSFQVMNALCSLGIVLSQLEDAEEIDKAVSYLSDLKGPPGRIELAGHHPNGGAIYVDYAHTPAGIETLLQSLRIHTKGKIWIVFGAGGNRDQGKRPLMGQAACAWADDCIITDDNPRFENPKFIQGQILAGCPRAKVIPDRYEAIKYAITHLGEKDICVITGKGPEDGQIIGDITYPFLDKNVVNLILGEL